MMSLFRASVASLVAMQAVFGLASSVQPAGSSLESRSGGSYVNMVYWPHWANKGLSDVDAKDITHVMYAFGQVLEDGTVQLRDPTSDIGSGDRNAQVFSGKWEQLYRFKQANPHVKTLLSIGGHVDKYSPELTWFATGVSTDEGRQRFVETAAQLMVQGGFDGLDIDWEFPEGHEQAQNHADLMKALRVKLDELKATHNGYHFLLTIALTAGNWYHRHLKFQQLIPVLDFWYVMAYDFTGEATWAKQLHGANLHRSKTPDETEISTNEGIESLIREGVPVNKMVLGIPAYAWVFQKLSEVGDKMTTKNYQGTRALNQIDTEKFTKVCDGTAETCIVCDEAAVACLGYDREADEVLSFDTAKTIATKADYIKERGLAGVFLWDLNQDLPGEKALYVTAARALGQLDSSHGLLEYPELRFAKDASETSTRPVESKSTATSQSSTTTSSLTTTSVYEPTTMSTVKVPTSSKIISTRPWGNTTATERSVASEKTASTGIVGPNKAASTGSAKPVFSGSELSCTGGDRCPGYIQPAIDADGRVVKTVFATVIVVACADKAVCDARHSVAITQSVFATFCPTDVAPPAPTVSLSSDAGAKPVPVTVEGRVATLCVTELGCRATDGPAPGRNGGSASAAGAGSAAGGLPKQGAVDSVPGGSSSHAAAGAVAGVSPKQGVVGSVVGGSAAAAAAGAIAGSSSSSSAAGSAAAGLPKKAATNCVTGGSSSHAAAGSVAGGSSKQGTVNTVSSGSAAAAAAAAAAGSVAGGLPKQGVAGSVADGSSSPAAGGLSKQKAVDSVSGGSPSSAAADSVAGVAGSLDQIKAKAGAGAKSESSPQRQHGGPSQLVGADSVGATGSDSAFGAGRVVNGTSAGSRTSQSGSGSSAPVKAHAAAQAYGVAAPSVSPLSSVDRLGAQAKTVVTAGATQNVVGAWALLVAAAMLL